MPPLPSSPKRNPKMHICDCYGFTVCGVVRGVHVCVLIYICMYSIRMYECTDMHMHVCTYVCMYIGAWYACACVYSMYACNVLSLKNV